MPGSRTPRSVYETARWEATRTVPYETVRERPWPLHFLSLHLEGRLELAKKLSVSSIIERRVQRRHLLELRAESGAVAATVEIPTPSSTGARVRLRQAAWTAAELRRLVRVLTRAAEKLDR